MDNDEASTSESQDVALEVAHDAGGGAVDAPSVTPHASAPDDYAAIGRKLGVPVFHALTGNVPRITSAPDAAGLRAGSRAEAFLGSEVFRQRRVCLVHPVTLEPFWWDPVQYCVVSGPVVGASSSNGRGGVDPPRVVSVSASQVGGRRRSSKNRASLPEETSITSLMIGLPDASPRTGPSILSPTRSVGSMRSRGNAQQMLSPATSVSSSKVLSPRRDGSTTHNSGDSKRASMTSENGIAISPLPQVDSAVHIPESEALDATTDHVICGVLQFRGFSGVTSRFWVTRFVVVDERNCTLARYKDQADYEWRELDQEEGAQGFSKEGSVPPVAVMPPVARVPLSAYAVIAGPDEDPRSVFLFPLTTRAQGGMPEEGGVPRPVMMRAVESNERAQWISVLHRAGCKEEEGLKQDVKDRIRSTFAPPTTSTPASRHPVSVSPKSPSARANVSAGVSASSSVGGETPPREEADHPSESTHCHAESSSELTVERRPGSDDGCDVLLGTLEKRGERNLFGMRKWRARWCELRDGLLWYFASHEAYNEGKTPQRDVGISVANYQVFSSPPKPAPSGLARSAQTHPGYFCLIPSAADGDILPGRVWEFRAGSSADRDAWIEAIRGHQRVAREALLAPIKPMPVFDPEETRHDEETVEPPWTAGPPPTELEPQEFDPGARASPSLSDSGLLTPTSFGADTFENY
jgi:hypothetical protein